MTSIGPGAIVEVEVERPAAGGRMVARHEGRVLLVAGAIPGEVVRARVTHRTGGAWFAETLDVIATGGGDRVSPVADPSCGGLTYGYIRYERQLELKSTIVADAFRRIAKRPLDTMPAVHASPEAGYRMRATLHVRDGRMGFFREATHEICDADSTRQLLPAATAAGRALYAALGARAAGCAAITLTENIAGLSRVAHIEPRERARCDDLVIDLAALPGLTGVTTANLGRPVVLCGDPVVADTALELFGDSPPCDPSARWTRRPTSFFQANRFLVGRLARRVLDAARGERVVDLYAGVGLFAVALAARGTSVVAVEGDRSSGADLSANARPWKDLLLVVREPVEEAVTGTPRPVPDAVILDPPRTGVSREALRGVLAWRVPRVVYVSCDPATLGRDAVRLFEAGYDLRAIECFDFFPNTPHVETVAVFDRP